MQPGTNVMILKLFFGQKMDTKIAILPQIPFSHKFSTTIWRFHWLLCEVDFAMKSSEFGFDLLPKSFPES
jgi:hypothetical protein